MGPLPAKVPEVVSHEPPLVVLGSPPEQLWLEGRGVGFRDLGGFGHLGFREFGV